MQFLTLANNFNNTYLSVLELNTIKILGILQQNLTEKQCTMKMLRAYIHKSKTLCYLTRAAAEVFRVGEYVRVCVQDYKAAVPSKRICQEDN